MTVGELIEKLETWDFSSDWTVRIDGVEVVDVRPDKEKEQAEMVVAF